MYDIYIYLFTYLLIYLYEIYVWSMMFRMFRCDFRSNFWLNKKDTAGKTDSGCSVAMGEQSC